CCVYYPSALPPPSPLFPYTTLFRSSGGTGIVARSSQQKSVTQRVFVLVAAHQPNGGRGAFQGLAGTPAAGPAWFGTNQIIQRFQDRKSTRLNSSHVKISYAVFCLKK